MDPACVADRLATPLWVIKLEDGAVLWANDAAQRLSGGRDVTRLRGGPFSRVSCEDLADYLPLLSRGEDFDESWTLYPDGVAVAVSCRCTPYPLGDNAHGILVEGTFRPDAADTRGDYRGDGVYSWLFRANTAPMLLIDPERDGLIVDANPPAVRFYGHTHEELCRLHVYDINLLGRAVLPVMREVASWDGGHPPLRFRHRVADGSVRDVQTYAGPVEINGRRLMLSIIHDVTAEADAEQLNRLLLENIHTGIFGTDLNGDFTFVNPAAARMFGYRHQSELSKRNVRSVLPPQDEQCLIREVVASGKSLLGHECRLQRATGQTFPAQVYAAPVRLHDETVGVVVSFSDLSAQKEREAQLSDLANSFPGAVFQLVVTRYGELLLPYLSSGALELFGGQRAAQLSNIRDLLEHIHADDTALMVAGIKQAACSGHQWRHEFRTRNGEDTKWVLARAQPHTRNDGSVLFNGMFIDISEQKLLEQQLQHAAHHDPLTGIANRRHFENSLRAVHAQARRYRQPFSLLMLDIDHFKAVNDRFGHDVGDRVLQVVSSAIDKRLRTSDYFCRWGGEEFMILLPQTVLEPAQVLAESLRGTVADLLIPPLARLTISIGVAEGDPGEDLDGLIIRVDEALFEAKGQGRNRVALAAPFIVP